MSRTPKLRASTPSQDRISQLPLQGSAALSWLGQRMSFLSLALVWRETRDKRAHLLQAGITRVDIDPEALLRELRTHLPASLPRIVHCREMAPSSALALFAQTAQANTLALLDIKGSSRTLLVTLPDEAIASSPAKLRDIAAVLESAEFAAFRGWIQEECLHEETRQNLADLQTSSQQNQRLQQLVEIAARMESAHALASGLSHDINNSIGILLGYAAFLREKLAAQREFHEELDGIERAATRIVDLSAKLSAFAKARGTSKKTPLRLDQILPESIASLRNALGPDITTEFSCEESLPAIESDPAQIQEILNHFAMNARDAMPRGGLFSVRVRSLGASELAQTHGAAQKTASQRWILWEVQDTGCGIPAHLLPRVFEPFFTTKEGKEGAGLGCAMIYSIVRSHRGWIEVDSPAGSGAQFRIYLPAAE